MFNSARLTLTAWYLLIIMVISGAFSTAIYRMLSGEVDRLNRQQRDRFERFLQQGGVGPRTYAFVPAPDPYLVAETKQRIFTNLVFINSIILIFAGGLGYFLAGRTLRPIQAMVDDQKRFISDSSHELRTPLTSLKMAFEVYLRNKKKTLAEANELVKESLEDINKLQTLTDSLLHLVRYENRSISKTFSPLSLKECLEVALQKIAPQAQKKKVFFDTDVRDSLVNGDRDQLIQLIVILLDNAIKYSPNKSTVGLQTHLTHKEVSLTIADHGIGIEAEHLPHIFDRFYRSDKARTKTGTNGYGLGLAIANKIVETHGARITVQSQVGQGTAFTVTFPRAK
jgi:two-component system sensor histidine kinase CiaH